MILPTMTPKEKQHQMELLLPHLIVLFEKKSPSAYKTLIKAVRYPAFMVIPTDIRGMGKWHVIIEAESKSSIRKGVACIRAYQTFHVSRAKSPANIGTGIYLMNADDYGNVQCQEYPPHYFNRLRERYIAPKGIAQPDFHHLVIDMLRIHHNSMGVVIKGLTLRKDADGTYSMTRDNSIDRQDGYDNMISYHKEGVSLGVSAEGKGYLNFTTFVPNSMLREGQEGMRRKMMNEMRELELRRQTNPFATIDKNCIIQSYKDI